MSDSGDLSDGLDEFEASGEEQRKTKAQNVSNKPYDEAYEISADLSMAESFDGREAAWVVGPCVESIMSIHHSQTMLRTASGRSTDGGSDR